MNRPISHERRAKDVRLVPAGLLALGVVPTIAGALRLAELGSGSAVTAENARFFAAPAPVVLHIVSAVFFSVLGAFQFFPGLRRSRPQWHRYTGRLAAPLGLAAALSGLWMTLFYPNADANFDGPAVYVMRLAAGFGMVAAMVLALMAIGQRNIPAHQRWMTRAYALGIGAGTQVFTHIPWFLLPGLQGEPLRAMCMGAGWGINIIVAEWVLGRARRSPAGT
jgi:uncharacterized membrane protein